MGWISRSGSKVVLNGSLVDIFADSYQDKLNGQDGEDVAGHGLLRRPIQLFFSAFRSDKNKVILAPSHLQGLGHRDPWPKYLGTKAPYRLYAKQPWTRHSKEIYILMAQGMFHDCVRKRKGNIACVLTISVHLGIAKHDIPSRGCLRIFICSHC